MLFIDGGNGKVFNFELSDKEGNNHFYEIYSTTLQQAVKLAQVWFVKLYQHKATHLEQDVIGFPITKNI